jgi:hypothetical protein
MTSPVLAALEVVVGRSARMRAVFEFLRVIGTSESTVLITGESGTGKEVTATLIHQGSRRGHRPFVAVSCALFSETLIESELFGHERGAFTGQDGSRWRRRHALLDDIDDVPLSMQVSCSGCCAGRRARSAVLNRAGNAIIAGSKKDLHQMVAEGKFRETCSTIQRPAADAAAAARRHPTLMDRFIGATSTQGRRCAADLRRRKRRSCATAGPACAAGERCEHRAGVHAAVGGAWRQACCCTATAHCRSRRRTCHRRWSSRRSKRIPHPRASLETHRFRLTIAFASWKPA